MKKLLQKIFKRDNSKNNIEENSTRRKAFEDETKKKVFKYLSHKHGHDAAKAIMNYSSVEVASPLKEFDAVYITRCFYVNGEKVEDAKDFFDFSDQNFLEAFGKTNKN